MEALTSPGEDRGETRLGAEEGMDPEADQISFGPFLLDRQELTLTRNRRRCRLQPQQLRVLMFLASRPGRLVTREALRKEIWGEDHAVDYEHGLSFAIKEIRKVLGDSARAPRYIETVPREGYRFIAAVDRGERAAESSPPSGTGEDAPQQPQSMPGPSGWRRSHRVWGLGGALFLLLAGAAWFGRFGLPEGVAPEAGAAQTGARLPITSQPGAQNPSLPPTEEPIRVALIPFEAIGIDSALVDGMSLDLVGSLGRIAPQRISMIGYRSMTQFRGTTSPASEIGRRLKVALLVEGQVRQQGDHLHVDVMLVDSADDSIRWSSSFEREDADLLAVQQELAAGIARQILPAATLGAASASALPIDKAVYRRYAEANWNLASGRFEGRVQAIEDLRQVVRAAPEFALGQAALASVLVQSAFGSDLATLPEAFSAAETALRLDPNLSEAHFAFGFLQAYAQWDLEKGTRSLARAIELDPSNARALAAQANLMVIRGNTKAAAQMSDLAIRLDPLVGDTWLEAGYADYLSRNFDLAQERCERSLGLGTTHRGWAALCVLNSSLRRGAEVAAEQALDELELRLGEKEKVPSELSIPERVRRLRERTVDGLKGQNHLYGLDYLIALRSADLGRTEEAIDFLSRAQRRQDLFLPTARVDPSFDGLRSDARFQAILAAIEPHGIPQGIGSEEGRLPVAPSISQ